MTNKEKLFYTKEHEWINQTSGIANVGVSAYAVEQLGDIVHLELPKVGTSYKAGDAFGTIESTKTVSDLYMPVAGKVIEVNVELLKKPEALQTDAFEKGWLLKLEVDGPGKTSSELMSYSQYQSYIAED